MYKLIIKYSTLVVAAFALACSSLSAQNTAEDAFARSRRSSLCSILVKHNEQKYADEIENQFSQIPISDRFNDHNLSVRTVSVSNKKIKDDQFANFIENNQIASRLVARWFDRNILTGECTLDTIKIRGLYDATSFDRDLASRSARGQAILEDAGEDLIGNTFLLLNEVNYVDKAKRSQIWGAIGGIALGVLSVATGGTVSDATKLMQNTNDIISSYKGFSVKIRTRLYRLKWDDEVSSRFYNECYTMRPDEDKKLAFESLRPHFKLEYMGMVESKGGRTSFLGIKEEEPEIMIRKACARAIDENIVDLQHKFEPFRIKSPLLTVSPSLTAPIGKKEGVNAASKFEVLEVVEDKGKVKYKRVAVIKPVASKIWDNRFMSAEEGAANNDLGFTTFTKVSGGEILSGMVIREID